MSETPASAQRLTASHRNSQLSSARPMCRYIVLNALRHLIGIHLARINIDAALYLLCSTPYGISIGIHRSALFTPSSPPSSAQRLTASHRNSLEKNRPDLLRNCVLNALRHLIGIHPILYVRIFRLNSAQRLTASHRNSRRCNRPRTRSRRGAQRLTASHRIHRRPRPK